MPGWASPWLWTAETWAGLQFGVLFVGLIVAWTQVREAVRLREDSTRPFVSIDLYVDDKIIHLSVTNLGPTMARDIQFAFEPPLRSASVQDQIASLKMFGPEGIPSLPPGKVITTVFDVFPAREEAGGYEDSYRVHVTYHGERGKRYADHIVLDLALYRDRVSVRRYTIHDIYEVLSKTHQEIRKCTALLEAVVREQ